MIDSRPEVTWNIRLTWNKSQGDWSFHLYFLETISSRTRENLGMARWKFSSVSWNHV